MLGTGGALGGRLRGLVSIPPPIGHWKLSVVGKARGGLDEASRAARGASKSWDLRRKKGSLCVLHTATRDGCAKKGSL